MEEPSMAVSRPDLRWLYVLVVHFVSVFVPGAFISVPVNSFAVRVQKDGQDGKIPIHDPRAKCDDHLFRRSHCVCELPIPDRGYYLLISVLSSAILP